MNFNQKTSIMELMKFLNYVKLRSVLIHILSILIIIITSTACGADNYIDPANSSKTHFSPPTWIIGKWVGERTDLIISPNYEIFEFTESNFIGSSLEGTSGYLNFNRYINGNSWKPEVLSEKKQSTEYEIIIKATGTPSSYRFVKISDTEIMYHFLHNKDLSEPETPYRLIKME